MAALPELRMERRTTRRTRRATARWLRHPDSSLLETRYVQIRPGPLFRKEEGSLTFNDEPVKTIDKDKLKCYTFFIFRNEAG
jgi:hypothetical protein